MINLFENLLLIYDKCFSLNLIGEMQKEIQGHTAAIKGVSWGAVGK